MSWRKSGGNELEEKWGNELEEEQSGAQQPTRTSVRSFLGLFCFFGDAINCFTPWVAEVSPMDHQHVPHHHQDAHHHHHHLHHQAHLQVAEVVLGSGLHFGRGQQLLHTLQHQRDRSAQYIW